jgi:tetratricopeptide (TPR) repeat protein
MLTTSDSGSVVAGDLADFEAATERARHASQRRDWAAALQWWNVARTHAPDRAQAHAGAGNALRELGRLDEAESLIGAVAERFPDHEQIAILLGTLASARHDWPTAVNRWESARRRFPNNLACYSGSLNALRSAGRPDEADALLPAAQAALDAANGEGAESMSRVWLGLAIAKARLDWPAVRRWAEEGIARNPNPPARLFLELAQACWSLNAVEEAKHAAQRALVIDPTLTEAIIIVAWTATAQGDGEQAIACYRGLAELNPDTARWSLKLVELLNWLGHVEEAVCELDRVCRRWPEVPMVRAFLKNFGPGSALTREIADAAFERNEEEGGAAAGKDVFQLLAERAPAETEWRRSLIAASPELDVQVAEVAGSRAAVLVFTGAGDGVSMPLSIFDRYLAALDVSAVYLKDFSRLLYLRGIRSLGADYGSALAALRDLLSNRDITRLAAIGNCDGAAAAVRYGIELGADFIIAASPSTHFPDTPLPRLAQARSFKRTRVAKNVAKEMMDLKPFLELRGRDAKIEVLYKEEDEWESSQALWISGTPGVTLRPQQGDPHHAALHRLALSSESLHDQLRKWLVGPPEPPRAD